MPIPLLLDTDIGSDVDDELALALLWGSPEVELRGVTTTYGNVYLRASIVLRMAELVGHPIDVAPGEALPRSGLEVWWTGQEGDAYDALPHDRIPTELWGARMLVERGQGATLLAIGPLTTVAEALDAGLAVDRIVVMGGDWADAEAAEHNFEADAESAELVLGSGIPITVVGVDVTRRVRFGEPEIARFARCGHLGAVIAAEMRTWMKRWDEDFEVPHDPLTALALIEPGLFTFAAPCAVEIAPRVYQWGREGSVRRLDEPGSVSVATDVDVDGARRAMADRIAAGLGERRRA